MPGRLVGDGRRTTKAAAATCSRCRHASSTSGAKRPPATSARTRRSSPWPPRSIWRRSGRTACAAWPQVNARRAHYAKQRLCAIPGCRHAFRRADLQRVRVCGPRWPADEINVRLAQRGFLGGWIWGGGIRRSTMRPAGLRHRGSAAAWRSTRLPLQWRRPLHEGLPLIFEQTRRVGCDRASRSRTCRTLPLEEIVGAKHIRREPAALPEVSELDLVRHFTRLSQRNYAIDTGLLPAGLVHDEVQPQGQRGRWRACRASRGSIRYQPERSRQGALRTAVASSSRCLARSAAWTRVTLQPAAGAHGELTAS